MLAPLCVTTAYNCTVSWKTQSQNRRRGTIRMAIFWYLVQHVIYSSVWVWSAVYVNLNALLNKKNHNYYSYHVEIENGKSLLLSRACFWKYLPPFVLLMGLEIKLHLCDFLVCVPTFRVLKWHLQCPALPLPPTQWLSRWLSQDQVLASQWHPRCWREKEERQDFRVLSYWLHQETNVFFLPACHFLFHSFSFF